MQLGLGHAHALELGEQLGVSGQQRLDGRIVVEGGRGIRGLGQADQGVGACTMYAYPISGPQWMYTLQSVVRQKGSRYWHRKNPPQLVMPSRAAEELSMMPMQACRHAAQKEDWAKPQDCLAIQFAGHLARQEGREPTSSAPMMMGTAFSLPMVDWPRLILSKKMLKSGLGLTVEVSSGTR